MGSVVSQQWLEIESHYAGVKLHGHVVMPNHLHGIIEICDMTGAMGKDCSRQSVRISDIPVGHRDPTVGEIVRGFKARCSRIVNLRFKMNSPKLWQRNYYEHIIRDEKSYLQILEYVESNPAKWHEDGYYANP